MHRNACARPACHKHQWLHMTSPECTQPHSGALNTALSYTGAKHQHGRSRASRWGVDIQAWKQAHDRLDAYRREQAEKQRQCAPRRELSKRDAHLEQLAALIATVQKVRVQRV